MHPEDCLYWQRVKVTLKAIILLFFPFSNYQKEATNF